MKNKCNLRKIISPVFLLLLVAAFCSCNDWTDTESLTVIEPDIKEQNPELYARYLENLRNYKKSDHKMVYAWFDNSEKVPFSRAQHLSDVPDSIDVIVLMYPDNLAEWELTEIGTVRGDKEMRVMFPVGYDAILMDYNNMVAELEEDEESPKPQDFITYLADTLKNTLKLTDKYNYDGIVVGYNGKSILHMTDKEKETYISNETAFIGIITGWAGSHTGKRIVFEGKPQNLVDKTILANCEYIVIPCIDADNEAELTYNVLLAAVDGVPTDRFIVTAATASLDKTDAKTGRWADGTGAITSSAAWVSASHSGFTMSGLGIYNAGNDYYNTNLVYDHSRKAIDIMNPSLKEK